MNITLKALIYFLFITSLVPFFWIYNYCKIFNGVTLGNKNTEIPDSKQPTLQDNVVISTGAKVLGGITIGANSIIGANSVVINDIPENSIAVGIPSRVVKRNENKIQ